MEVPIDQIRPSPYQVRLSIKTSDLKGEIQKDGLLSRLTVRKKNGYYELIDGQRRLEALRELGWKKVPVEFQEVDDRKARLMVYKLNSIRESYSTEEKARYFKKLHDEGMTFYQIGKELNVDDNWVLAHINVFKFPEDIQQAIWDGVLSIKHVQTIEPLIGANIEDAIKVAREIFLRKLSVRETEELVKPRREAIERARVEAAKEVIGVATPISVKLETPEELERAAITLRKEARRKREEVLSPKERARIEADKRRKEEERRERKLKEKHIVKEEVRKEILKEPEIIKEVAEKLPVKEIRRILRERSKAKQRAYGGVIRPEYQELREADLVHKVIIGDARNVLRLMPDSSIDLVVTSPPYFDLKEYPSNPLRVNTESLDRYLEDLETIFDECFRVLRDGTFLCVVVGQFTSEEISYFIPSHIAQLLESIGFRYRREHIWMKPLGIQGLWNRGTTSFLKEPYPRNTMINIHHEHVLIYQKGDTPTVFHGRDPLGEDEIKEWCWSVWELPVSEVKEHPAPFPEAIAERLIKMYSYEGETVLDPFLGSGTTMKMAKALKRRSIGIDVASEYLPLIQKIVGGADIIRYDNGEMLDFIFLKS